MVSFPLPLHINLSNNGTTQEVPAGTSSYYLAWNFEEPNNHYYKLSADQYLFSTNHQQLLFQTAPCPS